MHVVQGWTPYHHPKCGNTFYCVPPSIQYRQSHSRNAHTCMKLRSAATPLAGGDGGTGGMSDRWSTTLVCRAVDRFVHDIVHVQVT